MLLNCRIIGCWGVLLVIIASNARAQSSQAQEKPPEPNYDEARVPKYTLPELLKLSDGAPVTNADTWTKRRRGELLELYRSQVFGRSPGRPAGMRWKVMSTDSTALGGLATRKEITVFLLGDEAGPRMNLLMYVPNQAKHPAPVILGYNFQGNHTVHDDPGITLATGWLPPKAVGLVDGRATDASRGAQASRWSVEYLLSRGYALATIYYGDIEPDHTDGWHDGVRSWLRASGELRSRDSDQSQAQAVLGSPVDAEPGDWGAISAWTWGLSRAMDYLETDADLNPKQVIVFGHSRLGKTALWAGAQDERFAIVISNDSGEGGAALARRQFGERTQNLNTSFPHWFCGNYKQYSGHEEKLPVDAHELLALCAPRPLYVASAIEDRWADPRGEFLAALAAEPAYRLFGLPGLGVSDWPPVDTPVGQTIGYHVRAGKHDVLQYDWTQYLNFADRHFGRK
jgi:hypothetical protein